MFARLTALILSLCVALPMCWCCVSVEPQAEQVASCCAKKHASTSEQAPQLPQDHNCPCARHEASRDVAATMVKAPVPELKPLSTLLWFEATLATVFTPSFETIAPRHDHGPPLVATPVYQRHCALLL